MDLLRTPHHKLMARPTAQRQRAPSATKVSTTEDDTGHGLFWTSSTSSATAETAGATSNAPEASDIVAPPKRGAAETTLRKISSSFKRSSIPQGWNESSPPEEPPPPAEPPSSVLPPTALDGSERGKELRLRTPMGRFGKTEELVGAAVYLASDASAFVTGEILVVDGGFLASGVNQ